MLSSEACHQVSSSTPSPTTTPPTSTPRFGSGWTIIRDGSSTSRQHPQNANKKTQLLQRHSLVCKKNTHQVELLNHSVIKLLLYHLTVMQMNNNYLLNGQLKFIWIYGIVSNRHVIPIRTWCYCSFNLFRIFAGWSVNDSITWAVRERYSS